MHVPVPAAGRSPPRRRLRIGARAGSLLRRTTSVPLSCRYGARKEGRLATVHIHEVQTHLTRVSARVAAGEEVVVLRDGKAVARLAPLTEKRTKRRFGALRGKIEVDDSLFEPLPDAEHRGFE